MTKRFEWIKIQDEQPDYGQDVIVCDNEFYVPGRYLGSWQGFEHCVQQTDGRMYCDFLYWFPIYAPGAKERSK